MDDFYKVHKPILRCRQFFEVTTQQITNQSMVLEVGKSHFTVNLEMYGI